MDYRKDTVYVAGGNPYTQSQTNNNMSGTDANAIYQATHAQDYAPEYNQPWMQDYQARLAEAGLQPYRGNQRYDMNPGSYVTGAGAFMMPSSLGTEHVLPRGYGSWEGMQNVPGNAEQAQYYANILNALLQSGSASPATQNALMKESEMTGKGIL